MPRIAAFHQVSMFSADVAVLWSTADAAAGRAAASMANATMLNAAKRARSARPPARCDGSAVGTDSPWIAEWDALTVAPAPARAPAAAPAPAAALSAWCVGLRRSSWPCGGRLSALFDSLGRACDGR